MIGLYWGRFNPPHKGHMKVIKRLLKEVDFLIIAIGSVEHKNTKTNPFDGSERARMIKAYLKEERISPNRTKVIPVSDGKSCSSAVRNVIALCPKFDVAYTSDENGIIKDEIFRLLSKKVKIRRFPRSGTMSSTRIRDAIANGRKWEYLTGKSVARIIRELDGIQRIKEAYHEA